MTARMYVGVVHLYQRIGRPALAGKVQCRFRPSCSEYSIEAVETFGIRQGVVLTIKRIQSCNQGVALGTSDPVPSVENRDSQN
ncbi:MAG: membrane protein insertion efficiency factor YidD [Gemmataceae bacterium]|nr:membrane protein insertion efficiency factor YidD [Gemmataceae bacterium]